MSVAARRALVKARLPREHFHEARFAFYDDATPGTSTWHTLLSYLPEAPARRLVSTAITTRAMTPATNPYTNAAPCEFGASNSHPPATSPGRPTTPSTRRRDATASAAASASREIALTMPPGRAAAARAIAASVGSTYSVAKAKRRSAAQAATASTRSVTTKPHGGLPDLTVGPRSLQQGQNNRHDGRSERLLHARPGPERSPHHPLAPVRSHVNDDSSTTEATATRQHVIDGPAWLRLRRRQGGRSSQPPRQSCH